MANHASLQRRAANTYTWDFPDVKFRVAALIRYRRKQSGSSIRLLSGSGSKVNQFVHVPTSVDTQHFIQIHARVLSNLANRQTNIAGNRIYLLLCRRSIKHSNTYNLNTAMPIMTKSVTRDSHHHWAFAGGPTTSPNKS